jgi:hypothetical protein
VSPLKKPFQIGLNSGQKNYETSASVNQPMNEFGKNEILNEYFDSSDDDNDLIHYFQPDPSTFTRG